MISVFCEDFDLRKLRSQGKCYVITRGISTASNKFFYINNPIDSTETIYIYNITCSIRPGDTSIGFVPILISSQNYDISEASPLNIINLKANIQSLSNVNIAGYDGTPPSGNVILAPVINGNAQSLMLDLQEEMIELPPGTCMYAEYGLIGGSSATCDISVRFIKK